MVENINPNIRNTKVRKSLKRKSESSFDLVSGKYASRLAKIKNN